MSVDEIFRPDLMAGQKVIVSGGGSGLGRVMAEAILALGGEIVIAGRRLAVPEQTAAELTAQRGDTVHPVACDIRDAESVEAMLEQAWDGGGPTGLINNAAGNFISRIDDLSLRAGSMRCPTSSSAARSW